MVVENKKKVMASHIFGGDEGKSPRVIPKPQYNNYQPQKVNNNRVSYPQPDKYQYQQARMQYEQQQRNLNQYNFVIPPRAQMPIIEDIPPPIPLPSLTPFPNIPFDSKIDTNLGIEKREIQFNFTPIGLPRDGVDALQRVRSEMEKNELRFDYNLKSIVPEVQNVQQSPKKQMNIPQQRQKSSENIPTNSQFIMPDGSVFS
ncbi:hypothetical protein TVAG_221640 [Trichomonas vaginalis G3]|uniref:Uncharacterized protein n=1 Tax=Trichomonas vaginalis (strain ATCC PRA-98 / G3) TaxID=412133 RepID=A2E3C0_TRIV3|nr:hypothetical protein TVAGG3_0970100 [Trichomonas vaginalis G3]EAY12811.1 hypothetical protein TVAG_221640 [Trichomonas vaginalis G3]KAI5488536.1 hypothetical protein TVAGG3_0970100 [Trichomonas vaginalis G3]|eukprot:XP_001325034.1 hypothetical protein [Trichomonas vaginalis G3]